MDTVNESASTTVAQRFQEPLGWEGIGGIVILVVAAVSLRDWLVDSSGAFLALRLVWVFLYVAAAAALTLRFGTEWLAWTIRRQPALCILLMIALASWLWSLAPLVSLQKAVSLVGTTVLGVFIGYTFPPRQIIRILVWAFALLIVSSMLAVVVLPAPEIASRGWRGMMGHKNTFGGVAALATILFLVATRRGSITPAWWGATLLTLSTIALTQARSRTSFAVLAVSLIVLTYLSMASATGRPVVATLRRLSLGLVLCVSVLPFLIGPLTTALGTDDGVNGRTFLWSGVATILSERPMTGYGYAVVWGRRNATLLTHIPITALGSAANAHNSILHIASELGIIAAIVACFYLLAAIADAARLFEREPSAFSVFALLCLISIVAMGFAEARLLMIHSIFWIVFVALTVAVRRSLERLEGATFPAGTSP